MSHSAVKVWFLIMATTVGLKCICNGGRQVFSRRAIDAACRLSPTVLHTSVRLQSNYFPVNDDVYGLTDHQKQVLHWLGAPNNCLSF